MDLQQNSGNDKLKVVLLLVITTAYQTEVVLFSLFCASRFTKFMYMLFWAGLNRTWKSVFLTNL